MPKRDWLLYVAIGIVALLGILGGLGIAEYRNPTPWPPVEGYAARAKAETEQSRRANTPEETAAWIDAIKRQGPKPPCATGTEGCEQGEDYHDALDLEAQWAAAAAGERMARLTVWQMLFGGVGLVLLWLTLKHTRDTAKAGIKAANAAEDSAKAAQESVTVASENARVQLRAFVHLDDYKTQIMFDADGKPVKWRLLCYLRNSGATHTKKLAMRLNIMFRRDDLPVNFDFPDLGAEENQRQGFIAPNANHEFRSVEIPINFIIEVWNKKRRMFVWGWAEYNDVFTGTQRWRTEFAQEVFIDEDPVGKGGHRYINTRRTKPFNGADDDCYRKPYT